MGALLDSLAAPFAMLPLLEAAGLGDARREALDAALADGLPVQRMEAWKYTGLRALERRAFGASTTTPAIDDAAIAAIPAPRLVFVNGLFDASRSDLTGLPAGIDIEPLSQALARGDEAAVHALARRFGRPDEFFARINAALAQEGMLLRVASGARAEVPVQLVSVGAPAGGDLAFHLRHVLQVGEGARVGLVEHVLAAGSHSHLSTQLLDVRLDAGAELVHARAQEDAPQATLFARSDVALARDARYRRLDLELGGGLARHELNIALNGDRAGAHANGVLLGTGRRHLDTRLGIDHAARDTSCELTWRGLAAGRSRAAFHGGILIRAGADGTAAALSNKNLLLSADAEIDTQPVLEIHADEVQAAHGATVGQLDTTALFYLRSRGLPADAARALLTTAFCRETLAVLGDSAIAGAMAARLDAALAGAALA